MSQHTSQIEQSARPHVTDEAATADEVDRIVAAWQRARPDLDTTPMQVFSRLTRLARQFDLLRRAAFSAHQLEAWEFDVLSSLRRSGTTPLTPGELMAELLVSSGTMTNRIDRLEAKGLVQRQPSPTDRRAILVALTPAGKTAADAALRELIQIESELLSSFSVAETRELGAVLRRLATVIDPDKTV